MCSPGYVPRERLPPNAPPFQPPPPCGTRPNPHQNTSADPAPAARSESQRRFLRPPPTAHAQSTRAAVVDVDDMAPQGQQTVEVTITTGPLKGMVATVPAPADPNPPILLDWLGLIGTMHVANDSIQLDIA